MPFDLSLGLEGTHVLVTGGCGLIGRVVVQAFLAAGCKVTFVDLNLQDVDDLKARYERNLRFRKADISKDIGDAFAWAESQFGTVQCCVALASMDLSMIPQFESLCDVDPHIWQRVFNTNINGTFLTCQRWLQGIRAASEDPEKAEKLKNVSCIIMGSESGRFGVRTMAAYAAGKSAVQQGLLLSLAQDASRIWPKARVNAVAPGAVGTERFKQECEEYGREWQWAESEATVPLRKAVGADDVARAFVFLASERWSGSVSGQCLNVDGGKSGAMVWPRPETA
ncbi:hypothetical protein BAUCODRAFT_36401 [Baudoinia panamericana UAMH 10762]|uniref:NAD(P)-binding protein n=1 Tax=Baudoinia panamericana (strain UAMH 10762) TaxID=717646 RepID=M2LIE7_BAUPA|nr:uncharacterized protein BAUCODRAFT_36401 [Baudoinia panamericana UAMH 10762]EMC93942.1 hypothetical protein BAUCODRAFT_36401 [Baudoinia panamericana UAMH 10762]